MLPGVYGVHCSLPPFSLVIAHLDEIFVNILINTGSNEVASYKILHRNLIKVISIRCSSQN